MITPASSPIQMIPTHIPKRTNEPNRPTGKLHNETANKVASVSASSTAGSVTMTLDQTGVTTGTTLTFTGSVRILTITGKIFVYSQPSANRTIYLDLDELITVGATS